MKFSENTLKYKISTFGNFWRNISTNFLVSSFSGTTARVELDNTFESVRSSSDLCVLEIIYWYRAAANLLFHQIVIDHVDRTRGIVVNSKLPTLIRSHGILENDDYWHHVNGPKHFLKSSEHEDFKDVILAFVFASAYLHHVSLVPLLPENIPDQGSP